MKYETKYRKAIERLGSTNGNDLSKYVYERYGINAVDNPNAQAALEKVIREEKEIREKRLKPHPECNYDKEYDAFRCDECSYSTRQACLSPRGR